MDINLFRSGLDAQALHAANGGKQSVEYYSYGHYIKPLKGPGLLGGTVGQIRIDASGRLIVRELTVSSMLPCGHMVVSPEQIAGYCRVCGKICCHTCLAVCDITGLSVCRTHYKIKHGVVVSTVAQKGLWRLKAKKLGQKKRIMINEKKQLTE